MASASRNVTDAARLYANAEALLADQFIAMPLFYTESYFAMAAGVTGIAASADGTELFFAGAKREIIEFNRWCFSPADRWSEADWAELLEDERALYYALLENGQIVGSIFLYDWQGERDFLKIMNLGVAPDRRGQGLACRLLQKAAEELKASTLARCCGETRESNLAMRRVFERCGYRLNKTEENYYENPTESACKYVLRREELE